MPLTAVFALVGRGDGRLWLHHGVFAMHFTVVALLLTILVVATTHATVVLAALGFAIGYLVLGLRRVYRFRGRQLIARATISVILLLANLPNSLARQRRVYGQAAAAASANPIALASSSGSGSKNVPR